MIDQILKDRTPDQKPRFFLHDEMKAWLADNLKVTMQASANKSIDYRLQSQLGLYDTLTAAHNVSISIELAGETIEHTHVTLHYDQYEKSMQSLANVAERCVTAIHRLEAENAELKRRIDLLENPLPV